MHRARVGAGGARTAASRLDAADAGSGIETGV